MRTREWKFKLQVQCRRRGIGELEGEGVREKQRV